MSSASIGIVVLGYDDIKGEYMEGLNTVENLIEAYGGTAKPETSPVIDNSGTFTVRFARPIVMPTNLLHIYDTGYVEVVPEVQLTAD